METQRKQRNLFQRLAHGYHRIVNKKPYIEFITALLSIPVLISVILINYNVLRTNKQANATPTPEKVIITVPGTSQEKIVTATPSEPCKTGIAPIKITSPQEGETVTDNPVTIGISYKQGTYCAVVWSYRINGGRWSDYDDTSIAIYNPPQGDIKLELRIKSVVGDNEETLTRNFTYKGGSTITPTTTASASAN